MGPVPGLHHTITSLSGTSLAGLPGLSVPHSYSGTTIPPPSALVGASTTLNTPPSPISTPSPPSGTNIGKFSYYMISINPSNTAMR